MPFPISNSMCCYSKATRGCQMKFERVNLCITLVDLSDDWTSSSTFVTFMGPFLAVYRVDENDMYCTRAKHAAKKI